MKTYPVCIGGNFKVLPNTFEVNNPFDGQVIACCSLAGQKELEDAITAAQGVEKELANLPSYKREEILKGIAQGLTNEREQLANLLAQEAAKPLKFAFGEVDRAIQTYLIAAEECKRLPSEYLKLDWT
ncbi:MAG: aldehyde dehydrogenase, partial [Bacteroidetes bacterium HGW-Bacteroidetes-15]